jgi:hypothetical protein
MHIVIFNIPDCLNYILNLALWAFLLKSLKEALKAAIAAIKATQDTNPYETLAASLTVKNIKFYVLENN